MVDGAEVAVTDAHRAAIYELAYREGIRVLEDQARTLEQLRVRMAAVLGTATTASAFLVGVVAKAASSDQDLPYWVGVVVGTLLYAFLLARTVQILRPKYEWKFNLSPKVIIEGYADHEQPATVAEAHRALGLILDENIGHNESNLGRMRKRLGQALVLFIAELACWAWLTAKVS